ncbi:serine/threonine-protein kinase PknK [Pendulispora albinea]|uniref:Protein kinase n=1 Tax=Pendulispora albinea TaxID=2741071 RepID=A0ABZ2LXM6_9BACT
MNSQGAGHGHAHSSTMFGRYCLLERLGQGGMAEVFKAKSFGVEGFEKILVIKRILPELSRSKEFVDMFIHEAKLAVRLSHANIVQVFDLGIAPMAGAIASPASVPASVPPSSRPGQGHALAAADSPAGAYFMAMEFVHGFDLATLLARCRRQQMALPIDMCAYMAAEIAKGLDHAHRRRDEEMRPLGIVHRDVSPQNVLISLEGEVKVTDFGIAKARGVVGDGSYSQEDTRMRKLQGKFGYMSPEQARGENVDARSDLFSLGVVLYECVTGVNPFSAPTTFETLRRVQAGEYPPLELLRTDAPPELIAILNTSLAKDPGDRYPDAGRMYEALLAFLYAQQSRYGAHDLAEFVARFRTDDTGSHSAISGRLLEVPSMEGPVVSTGDRTPVEVPQRSSVSITPPLETGVRIVGAGEIGERREVTALVIEFPQRDSREQADRAITIVKRYGGRIVRHEPEHLAVLFGLDDPDGRDTEVATRCALVALRAMGALAGDPLAPSAGLHVGRIHVTMRKLEDGEELAQATEDERFTSLLTTAREFARTRPGRAALSPLVTRQVKGLFGLEPLNDGDGPRMGLSGFVVKDVRGTAETFGRFVGRKGALRFLGESLALATKRRARLVTLRGDHGVGKTRLLYEVERRLRKGGYNVAFYMATCPPRGRELPLSGIACMLQVLCGLSEAEPAERVLSVQPRLRALGLHDTDVVTILNVLGAGLPTSGANAKNSLKQAFSRMLARLCEDKPYTLAWDAAHAMDQDSFDVLDAAVTKLSRSRLLLIFTCRAGFSHALEKRAEHAALELTDLTADDAAKLIAARLGIDEVPDELVRFVRERAGGHPLFIEEILKALADAQAVSVVNRKIETMRLVGQDLALPKTLRGLVASRVARLPSAEKTVLQAAAVLGDRVDVTVLGEMLGEPLSALEYALGELDRRELMTHVGAAELRFMSPILREVVLDALPPEAVRKMHAVAARALEHVQGDHVWEQSARVAAHYYEAGKSGLAAGYFAKSADLRLAARQLEAAVRDYARAIALADVEAHPAEELVGWLRGLAQAARMVRACPDAVELCARVIERADAAGELAHRVQARVHAGTMLTSLHNFETARAHFAGAERLVEGNEELAKSILLAYADMATRQGDFKRVLAMVERLERLVSAHGDKAEEHRVLLYRAQAHAGLGDRRGALLALARAEQLSADDAAATCERQKVRSLIDYFTRDFRGAALAAEMATDMARSLGLTYEVATNLHNLGDFLIRLDDLPRAYGAFRQSLELCAEGGFARLGSQNRMFLAFLDGINGDVVAEEHLRQGIAYAESNDYTWDAVNGRALLGQLLQRRGQSALARLELERARELARKIGNRLLADDCDTALRSLAS